MRVVTEPTLSVKACLQVGEYSQRTELTLQDLTWPGQQTSPPKGAPDLFHVRVVTLGEVYKHKSPDITVTELFIVLFQLPQNDNNSLSDEPPFVVLNEMDPVMKQCANGQTKCNWGEKEITGEDGGELVFFHMRFCRRKLCREDKASYMIGSRFFDVTFFIIRGVRVIRTA